MTRPGDDVWSYPRCAVQRVIDGDTLKLRVDQGLSTYRDIYVRLAHVNTPEIRHADGPRARDRVAELVAREPLTVTTVRDRTERYGRYLAEITNADGIDIGAQLLAEGLATPYEGGRR